MTDGDKQSADAVAAALKQLGAVMTQITNGIVASLEAFNKAMAGVTKAMAGVTEWMNQHHISATAAGYRIVNKRGRNKLEPLKQSRRGKK